MTQFRQNPFGMLPLVVKNLLIINVLVLLAQWTVDAGRPHIMEDLFGLHHVQSPLFQPWQIVTHLFLHGGFLHLFSNMIVLWTLGTVLENVWGPKRFLTFYFLCGIGAGLIQLAFLWYEYHPLLNQFLLLKQHLTPENAIVFFRSSGLSNEAEGASVLQNYLANPDNSASSLEVVRYVSEVTNAVISSPTIGASGAVFGVLAGFVYLFPNVDLFFIFFPIPIKAKWLGLAYFGYEIYSGIMNRTGDNIAHWAHIGGGLVGFLLVLTYNKKNRRNFY